MENSVVLVECRGPGYSNQGSVESLQSILQHTTIIENTQIELSDWLFERNY